MGVGPCASCEERKEEASREAVHPRVANSGVSLAETSRVAAVTTGKPYAATDEPPYPMPASASPSWRVAHEVLRSALDVCSTCRGSGLCEKPFADEKGQIAGSKQEVCLQCRGFGRLGGAVLITHEKKWQPDKFMYVWWAPGAEEGQAPIFRNVLKAQDYLCQDDEGRWHTELHYYASDPVAPGTLPASAPGWHCEYYRQVSVSGMKLVAVDTKEVVAHLKSSANDPTEVTCRGHSGQLLAVYRVPATCDVRAARKLLAQALGCSVHAARLVLPGGALVRDLDQSAPFTAMLTQAEQRAGQR